MFRARFERERENLFIRLGEEIRDSLSESHIAPVDDALEVTFDLDFIGKFTDTREMRFFLGAVEAFTPALINRIRRMLKAEFPKWSVVPQYEECEFTVFSNRVRFGDVLVKGDVASDTTALRDWISHANEIREGKFGALRRQLAWLRPRIKAALDTLSTSDVHFLGVFDQSRWGGCSVWLLERPESVIGNPGSVDLLPVSTFASAPESYPVDETGFVHPRFSRDAESRPVAWLLLFHTVSKQMPTEVEVYRRTPQYDANDNYIRTERGRQLCRMMLPPPLDDHGIGLA